MNDRTVLALCLLLSLASGALGAWLLAPSPASIATASTPIVDGESNRDTEADLARIERRLDELSMRIEDVGAQRRSLLSASEPVVIPGAHTSPAPDAAQPEVSGAFNPAADADWLVLDDPNSDLESRQRAWQRLRERGLLDDVLALMEERALASPDDPRAQFDLGVGCIEKIQEVSGMEAGTWATKADKAFDRTLALDEEHLDARLYKAMSLSFWPPIFGKRAEAMRQFEVLIEKQASHPQKDSFANSYVLLGNLHLESGNAEKALEVWQKGAALFPNDEDLAKQIANVAGAAK